LADYKGVQEDNVTGIENCEEAVINRRRHLRSVFTYPVEFKLLSQKVEGGSFVGYLKDISLSGAALLIEDRYGRFGVNEAKNSMAMLTLSIPHEDKIKIYAHIQRVKKEEDPSHINMGISFKNLDYKDLTVIEKLIGLKGKDHNMLWNLWEQYCR
jgi:hypothetical protein